MKVSLNYLLMAAYSGTTSGDIENIDLTIARRKREAQSPLAVGEKGTCPACGCVGPNPGYIKLSQEELVTEYSTLKQNGYWVLTAEGESTCLKRKFKCRNWQAAINFINAASVISEREDISHHPDLHLTMYRNIEITLWTHAAGGLTSWDFKLARALEGIKVDYSPKWLRENPSSIGTEVKHSVTSE